MRGACQRAVCALPGDAVTSNIQKNYRAGYRRGTISERTLHQEEINAKVAELALASTNYAGKDVLLVGMLKGAIMVMATASPALKGRYTMDWMAVSS